MNDALVTEPVVAGEADPTRPVLGLNIHATSYDRATRRVLAWAAAGESRCVCASTVHMVMEAHDDPAYAAVVNSIDLVTPDGVPLVWMLRWQGVADQQRVYGPTLMLRVCEAAAARGLPVGLYGGKPEVLEALQARLRERFPALEIAYAWSPPFRPLSEAEDAEVVEAIRRSGARIVFVGLGCPRQERWVAAHRGRIPAAMLAVGAAFDFHAGFLPQAPAWMQRAGLEWLFRLIQEPRRLARRYIVHNPRFVVLAVRQLLARRGRRR